MTYLDRTFCANPACTCGRAPTPAQVKQAKILRTELSYAVLCGEHEHGGPVVPHAGLNESPGARTTTSDPFDRPGSVGGAADQ